MVRILNKSALLAAPLALAVATSAHAQERPKNIALEIGANYAADGDVRDATQSTGIHVGLGYILPTRSVNPDHRSWTTIGLMYNQNSGNGNKLTVWGLTAEQRYSVASPRSTSAVRPYVGLGLGIYRDHAEADASEAPPVLTLAAGEGAGSSGVSEDLSETKTRLGGRLMAGVEISQSYYVELAYNLTGKVADARSDSFTLSAGARF